MVDRCRSVSEHFTSLITEQIQGAVWACLVCFLCRCQECRAQTQLKFSKPCNRWVKTLGMFSRNSLHPFLQTGNKAVTKLTFMNIQFGFQTSSYFNVYFMDTGMNEYLRPSIYSKKYNFTIKATQVIQNAKFIGKIMNKFHQMQHVFIIK
jgi:hypothetical protein